MNLISVIVPCYNEEDSIPIFYEEAKKVEKAMENYCFEYIFINDGSTDATLKILKDFSSKDSTIKYVSFSRNFGKEAAIYAGLSYANGDFITLMDVDLQDPPSLLPEMMKYIEENEYDSVATRRVNRKGEPILRSFFANLFYKIINKLSNVEIVDGARDYRLMTKQYKDEILRLCEYNRFSKGLFGWVGFKTKWLEFENVERVAGETKWSFWKLLLYSIEGIVAFSTAPLGIAAIMGLLFCLISLIFIVVIIVRTLIFGDPVAGWPSTICILLLVGGVQLLCTGILGEYLSKTYLETKKRPIYICKETNMMERKEI